MSSALNRRKFISNVAIVGTGLAIGAPHIVSAGTDNTKPAILGGPKAHAGAFPSWPVESVIEEKGLTEVLQSKKWGRLDGSRMATFEKEYSKLFGVKHSLGVSSGTSALTTILGALDIGPGDEVAIPVYTFVATYNVVVLNYALPILVDTDIESFQMDAAKAKAAITAQTRAIMPVHIGGSPVDLDAFVAMGKQHNIPVVEDACQAHLAEWKGVKVGNYGLAGAFSFQSSKNLNCAEGGAVITNNDDFITNCYTFHNQGQGGRSTSFSTGVGTRGTNLRLTEFQGSLLLAQMTRVTEQSNRRWENAQYLSRLLKEIPGITPAKLYPGTTRSAYHLYMFRYDRKHFAGLSREKFLQALSAEGVPNSAGYGQMNKSGYVTALATNKHYLKIYGEKTMQQWLERNQCPQNDLLTSEQSVWLFQNMLLGTKTDMEQIAEAMRKIQKYAAEIAKK
ncbi:DegT/DnrJ/EryC1/StrS family aminotransferase [Niabella sp. CC-SYL272]|uniref:DegT/DnrJ/EryC1/StrS family aminotransferase n=1 Tax=Niabella agricola TaxID=2891571 RepID=UPI001F357B77|nr:DegT/DnrJ/EryC1/StrS family aminotransferase [Niabella agricola]MCF3108741.1 DegT/DnrJ/EryC1/StrS family aminotransferase [Niabella agricola]